VLFGLAGMAGLAVLPGCRTVSAVSSRIPGLGGERPQSAEIFGSGSVRVALLLPRSAAGNGGTTATAFRNAAKLAIDDFPAGGIQIAVYDTQGTPDGAQTAVDRALGEGAEMILGPLFAGEVAAIAPQARQAGVPVVAFSSDAAVAGPGVYLLSFLPVGDVERIVSYAAAQGRRSFAGLFPAGAYGALAEGAFRSTAGAAGGRVVTVETYEPNSADVGLKVGAIAAIASQIDALLIPDGGEAVATIAAALGAAGITRDRVKLLGSGQWSDPRILNNTALVGSWFAAPANQTFEGFARRYAEANGGPPPRNATLAYDATVLTIGLVRQFGAQRFDAAVLTGPNGFTGVDGVFRFLPNGTTERRLAVYEVTGSGSRLLDPAARSFAAA
jgi:ABC-type branched-subunit amino acid transport system substrate-binding protein